MRLLDLASESRVALLPVKGSDAVAASAFSSRGFHLYPTGSKTTVFHDPASDCFFKILHPAPLSLRGRVRSLLADRPRQIHALSERLIHQGIQVPRVRAFGTLREGRKPFYAIERARGQSLYDLLIRERRGASADLCRKVIDAVASLHALGYWLGDAHLSHIFVHGGDVSGFIDIDSVRRNRPFRLSNLAKDMAGLNHPGLSMGRDDKASLLRRYLERMKLKEDKAFERLVEQYSEKRWRSARLHPDTRPLGP
jgi:tRNA A-37 threonylcarbamoyl transferase component Bud32